MSNDELLYKLALNFIPNIGSVIAKNLVSYCGGIKEVFTASKRDILRIPGIGEKKAHDVINNDALKKAESELKKLEKTDVPILFFLDENYPKRLSHYSDSPIILYKKGSADLNPQRTVAIVGTRKASSYGQLQTEKLVTELSQYNCTIISGLAYGVDTVAHTQSVKMDIPTIGVLGTGIDSIYPASNRKLSDRMIENGALLSEFDLNSKPDRENFPQRNRVIAGLSDVIIVVESAIKGGSMITAEYANIYSKDVFAIPGHLNHELSQGCNHLIKTHKAALLTNVQDIAYIMRWDQKPQLQQMRLSFDLNDKENMIVELLKENKKSGMEALHYKSSVSISELNSILLNLEFKGIVKAMPGKSYILT